MRHLCRTVTLGFACALLAACSGNTVKQTLGLDRGAPDEFRVVSRPPLSVPPDFSLRPPSDSDAPAGQVAASDQGAAIVMGNGQAAGKTASTAVVPVTSTKLSKSNAGKDKAEAVFLQNAGATQADPTIRDKLTQDRIARETPEDDSSWWDVFSTNPPKKDTLVNAKQEASRIQTNEAEGKPVTTGDTPVVKDKDTGVLGRIFGY